MSVVFIGGYLRTGTTLLQSILCSSPDCNEVIGEAIFCRGLLENYWRGLSLFDLLSKYYFDSREELRLEAAYDLKRFMLRTSHRHGSPQVLVLKHPQLTPFFPLLHELLPEAKLLVLVRDPRDTIASAVRAKQKGAIQFAGSSSTQLAQEFARYYQPSLDDVQKGYRQSLRFVKYESLVSYPSEIIGQIQEFTDVDLSECDPATPSATAYAAGQSERNSAFYSELYGKGISNTRVGVYHDILDEQDVK